MWIREISIPEPQSTDPDAGLPPEVMEVSASPNQSDIMDLEFRQPGFSPEYSKFEVTDSKASSFRSKLDSVVRKIIK